MKRSRSPYTGSRRPSKRQKVIDLWISKAPEVDLLDALEHHLHKMPRADLEKEARRLLTSVGGHPALDELDEKADEAYNEAQRINDRLENHQLVVDMLLNSQRDFKLRAPDKTYHMCRLMWTKYKNDWNAIHFPHLHIRRAKYHCDSCCDDINNCECRENLPPEVHPYIRNLKFSAAPRTLSFRDPVGIEHILELDTSWTAHYHQPVEDRLKTTWTWSPEDHDVVEAWLTKFVGGSGSVWRIVVSYSL